MSKCILKAEWRIISIMEKESCLPFTCTLEIYESYWRLIRNNHEIWNKLHFFVKNRRILSCIQPPQFIYNKLIPQLWLTSLRLLSQRVTIQIYPILVSYWCYQNFWSMDFKAEPEWQTRNQCNLLHLDVCSTVFHLLQFETQLRLASLWKESKMEVLMGRTQLFCFFVVVVVCLFVCFSYKYTSLLLLFVLFCTILFLLCRARQITVEAEFSQKRKWFKYF